MCKTSFSKGQLVLLHRILTRDKIGIFTDPFNSGIGSVYSVIRFVKGKKQLDIGFVTRTDPKNNKLKEQLYRYFGVEYD